MESNEHHLLSSRDNSCTNVELYSADCSVQSISSGDDSKLHKVEPDPLDLIPKLESIFRSKSGDLGYETSSRSQCNSPPTVHPLRSNIYQNNKYSKFDDMKNAGSSRCNELCDSMLVSNSSKLTKCIDAQRYRTHADTVKPNDRMIPSRSNMFTIFNRRLYLPKAHELPVKMGNQALTTFRSQQEVMINSLKDLHAALKNFPVRGIVVSPPKYLLVQLLHHQLEGLAWLLWRESEIPAGGIMADDMGLGKTLQMISLILKTKEVKENVSRFPNVTIHTIIKQRPDRNIRGGTLVVSPSSVLGHWSYELKTRVKKGALSVYAYHGLPRIRNISTLMDFDVVLTTYGVLQKELDTGPLRSITWDRIILDEAHVIRNHRSRNALSIFCLKASKRWVLTGTPVHNKSEDYYSLIKFLNLTPFSDLAIWKKFVGNKHESGQQRLLVINKAIMLRRMKEQIKSSDEHCGLRQKFVESIKVELDPDESLLYENVSRISKAILAQFVQEQAEKEQEIANKLFGEIKIEITTGGLEIFKNHPNLARLYNNFVSTGDVKTHEILVLLLRLRQLCCHPSLIHGVLGKRDFQGSCGSEVSDDDLTKRPKRLDLFDASNEHSRSEDHPAIFDERNPLFKRERISSKIRAVLSCLERIFRNCEEDKVIVVSQWPSFLSIIEKFISKKLCMTCMSLNGKVPLDKRQEIVDYFNSTSMRHRVLLLSLTAGGVGLNLVGGNHLLFVDLHWNPQLEIQASDRIYRFGQIKDVFIYKFICKRTIEERILKLQQSKLSLADGILDSCNQLNLAANTLTIKDLRLLFGVEDNDNKVITNN